MYPQKISGISEGQKIYRNFDREFCRKLTSRAAQRTVRLSISLRESPRGLLLAGRDEDGNEGVVEMAGVRQSATKKEDAEQVICRQLTRLGNTIFECHDVQVDTETIYFLPTSRLNAARRALVELLLAAREKNRPRRIGRVSKSTIRFPQEHLTYMGNVLNSLAAAFYRRHGVRTIEPAAESGIDLTGRTVMTTKYCLQRELGLCDGKAASHRTLSLVDADGREFGVRFRCGNCGMEISLVACLRARPS